MEKVNPKMLVGLGILLVVAFFVFNPLGELKSVSPKDKSSKETVTKDTNNKGNDTEEIEYKSILGTHLEVSEIDIALLNSLPNENYVQNLDDLVSAKKNDVYSTYTDTKDYISNPYYQRYFYSSEGNSNTSSTINIHEFPYSFGGAYTQKEDYTAKKPK